MNDSRQLNGRTTETYYGCRLVGRIYSAAYQNEWIAFDRENKEIIGGGKNIDEVKNAVRAFYNIEKRIYTRKPVERIKVDCRRNIRAKIDAVELASGTNGTLRAWFLDKCLSDGRIAAYTELCNLYYALCG